MRKITVPSFFRKTSGFTLIELLIVIAILGVLAAVVLIAIDPLEQLARARDSGRKSSVAQLGHAMQAYYTVNNAVWLTGSADWEGSLVSAGELKNEPINPLYAGNASVLGCYNNTAGTADTSSGYCYSAATSAPLDAIIFVKAESKSEKTKANCPNALLATPTSTAWIVWSSAIGKVGLFCKASVTADPLVSEITTATLL